MSVLDRSHRSRWQVIKAEQRLKRMQEAAFFREDEAEATDEAATQQDAESAKDKGS